MGGADRAGGLQRQSCRRKCRPNWAIISRFPVEFIDASQQGDDRSVGQEVSRWIWRITNAVDLVFNEQIFGCSFQRGRDLCGYGDDPVHATRDRSLQPMWHPSLGHYQFERANQWEEKGLLALGGHWCLEPGMADVFARYAQDYLFDEIDEIGIRDGANIEITRL